MTSSGRTESHSSAPAGKPRARDLGVPFLGDTGPLNAITDVAGVAVGHTTLISGHGELHVGKGPVRTGATAVVPRAGSFYPVMAGWYTLNGCGELTGTTWIEESGFLHGPIVLTNTLSIGVAHEGVITWSIKKCMAGEKGAMPIGIPVAGETYDGGLNDIAGFHVKQEHILAALDGATTGGVPEGSVGGGTGMVCHYFKGGIGTSSRAVTIEDHPYTVGVLFQANHGTRPDLMIAGVPIGLEIRDLMPEKHSANPLSSIIVLVATDCPLVSHQLKRLARRVPIGIGRVGGVGTNSSGEIFLAFSTANPDAGRESGLATPQMLPNARMDPLFHAVVYATEEAIVNALVAAETMVGVGGNVAYALPHDRLREALRKYNRLVEPTPPAP